MIQPIVTGAGTGLLEHYVYHYSPEEAVKLGAVMAGCEYAVSKLADYAGQSSKKGLKVIGAAAAYAFVAPKVVDTDDNTVGRALSAVGGMVAGGVAIRTLSRSMANGNMSAANGGGAYDVSTYSGGGSAIGV